MGKSGKIEPTAAGFRFSPPVLHRLGFERDPTPIAPAEGEEATLDLELGHAIARLGESSIGYELTADISLPGAFRMTVSYRAVFELLEAQVDAGGEGLLRTLAARNAPAALYPFIRETVHGVVLKSLALPVGLPVVNFSQVWDLDDVEIPEFKPTAGSPPDDRKG